MSAIGFVKRNAVATEGAALLRAIVRERRTPTRPGHPWARRKLQPSLVSILRKQAYFDLRLDEVMRSDMHINGATPLWNAAIKI
jgi:hypothetical protein